MKHLAPNSLQHIVSEQSSVESEHCPGGGVVKAGHGVGRLVGISSPRNIALRKCPDSVSSPWFSMVFNGFQLPTIMRKGAKRIRIDKVTVKAFSKSLSHDSSAHCWAYAWPMLYLSDTYPESEWQSFQPPSPLAPGRSAEQASCLSLTAQLASEIFNSLKKFSLGVYSSYLKPSQPSRPCFHSQSQAKVSASQGYDKI